MRPPRAPRTIALRTLRDARRTLVGYSIALALLTFMMGVFWPTIQDQGDEFQQLIENYPPAMQAFFGDFDEFTTPQGYLRAELFSLMLPILMLLFAIGRSADTIAGDEERGALDTLLALPVSRRRAFLEKAGGVALGLLVVVGVVAVSLIAIDVLFAMGVGVLGILAACLMLLLLALAHVGVTFALAGFRGRKGWVLSVAATFAVASWLLASFGNLVDALRPFRVISVFAHYNDVNALRDGLDPVGALVLLAVALAGVGLGLWLFERRDLAV